MRKSMWLAATALTAWVTPGEALAQEGATAQEEPQSEEIVVTAQKREQNILDTPLAISAYGDESLERMQVSDVADLASIAPGLQGVAVSSGQPLLSVRGIGSNDFSIGNDPALGIFIDEIYAGRSAGAITNLFDVNRVEVVRGPQGTLFGRNTTAGAISIVRNQPSSSFEGNLSASYAKFDDLTLQGVVSGPLSDGVAVRAGAYYHRRDGYIDGVQVGQKLGGLESFSGRLATRIEPSDRITVDLGFDYQHDDGSSAIYQSRTFNGGFANLAFRQSATNLTADQNYNKRDIYLASGRITAELGDFKLTSISAFRHYTFRYQEDTDGGPASLLAFSVDEKQDAYSQELRLNYASDRVDWFIGASYFHEDLTAATAANYAEEDICGAVGRLNVGASLPCGPLLNFLSGGLVPVTFVGLPSVTDRNNAEARYKSFGVYSDLTYHFSDRFRASIGLRFSHDSKRVVAENPAPVSSVAPILLGSPTIYLESTTGPIPQSQSWSNWSPRLNLQYDLGENTLLYGGVSRGYKSGGFNLLVPSGGAFNPEKVTSYEAGVKGSAANGRFTYDIAGFYYTYDNLQVQIINAFPITENAGSARGYGLEASFQARPVEGLRLGSSLMLLNAEYTRYSPSPGISYAGNKLNRAPSFAASFQIDYEFDLGSLGNGSFGGNLRHTGSVFHSPDNNPLQFAPKHTLVDLYAGIEPAPNLKITAFINNVFGERYITQTQQISALGIAVFQAGDPTVAGLRVQLDF